MSITVVGGVLVFLITMTIGLFVGDRQKLSARNDAQDRAHNDLSVATAKQFADINNTLTALTKHLDRFQDYPNSAGALEKRIADAVEMKIKSSEERVTKHIDTVRDTTMRQIEEVKTSNKEQLQMVLKDSNDKYELLKTWIQGSAERLPVRGTGP